MKRISLPRLLAFGLAAGLFVWIFAGGIVSEPAVAQPALDSAREAAADKEATGQPVTEVPTVEAARGRARLLHEAMHATLQVVHHEYYREDEGLAIPAATLKTVFKELGKRQKVELRWLVVNAKAMNVDHNPQNDFEKEAVAALASGKHEFELAKDGVYRHAGLILLTSECLKCHLPRRTSTDPRAAGLVISVPCAPD